MASSSDESDIETNDFYDNFSNKELLPYEFEPQSKKSEVDNSSKETTHVELSQSRKGNTEWCKCGNCKMMSSEEESVCCHDDVPESYLDGKKCIIENEHFGAVCLQKEVLKTVLHMLNNIRGDKIDIKNESFRYAGYRQFTWWVHNHLGKGVRKVIPSCALWCIRDTYPKADGSSYIPFQEARDEINVDFE